MIYNFNGYYYSNFRFLKYYTNIEPIFVYCLTIFPDPEIYEVTTGFPR